MFRLAYFLFAGAFVLAAGCSALPAPFPETATSVEPDVTPTANVVSAANVASGAQQPSPNDYILEYDAIHHPVISRGGMVVSQNDVASEVGAEILKQGGNAIDAAIATGFALAVTLPRAGNLGGGGFMLIHLAREKRTVALEYYGAAPLAVRPDLLLDENGKFSRTRRYTFLGVAVPGTVAGFYEAHRTFGRLRWRDVVAPAIRLSRQGIVVTDDMSWAFTRQQRWLSEDPAVAQAFFKRDGGVYRPGERLIQPDLARTLEAIQVGGADAFYRGPVGERLASAMRKHGGVISREDLAAYRPRMLEPLWGTYREHRIAYMPPPASGVALEEMMNILEQFPVASYGQNSAECLHVLAEAMKLVTADRRRFMGGYPQVVPPADELGDKGYARRRAALISLEKSTEGAVSSGEPLPAESRDTTHYSVVDADGNAVSNTFTLGSSFGAHVMAEGTGFLLNDTMGNFSWRAGKPHPTNSPEPGKRAVSTITPILVFRGDDLWLASGTPGGSRIIGAMAQLLVNLIDFDLNVAEATARPRIFVDDGADALEAEPGFTLDTLALLKAKGQRVVTGNTIGSAQSILLENGVSYGAPDTRRPGAHAAGVSATRH